MRRSRGADQEKQLNEDGNTKHIVPFSYGITVFVPILAPLFAYFLLREGRPEHAAGVVALAVVWVIVLFGFIL